MTDSRMAIHAVPVGKQQREAPRFAQGWPEESWNLRVREYVWAYGHPRKLAETHKISVKYSVCPTKSRRHRLDDRCHD